MVNWLNSKQLPIYTSGTYRANISIQSHVSLLFGVGQVVCSGFIKSFLLTENSCLLLLGTRLMRAVRPNQNSKRQASQPKQ